MCFHALSFSLFFLVHQRVIARILLLDILLGLLLFWLDLLVWVCCCSGFIGMVSCYMLFWIIVRHVLWLWIVFVVGHANSSSPYRNYNRHNLVNSQAIGSCELSVCDMECFLSLRLFLALCYCILSFVGVVVLFLCYEFLAGSD